MSEAERRTSSSEASGRAAAPWTVARLLQRMEARGEAPAVLSVREGWVEAWSYRELTDTVRCLAAGLREAGLASGEPVAIYGPNAPEWIAVALALNTVGALVVPVDDIAGDEHARSVLADSGARWLFSTRAHLAALRRIVGLEGFRLYTLDASEEREAGATSWRRLLAETPGPIPELRPDEPACLFYTSGTTGPPKAFILTHANIGTNVQALAAEGLVAPGDRALIPLPLHHAYPYVVGMLTSLETGMAIVLPQSVTGPHIAQALHAARVTVIVGVPRLYEALLSGLEAHVAAHGRLAKRLFSSLLDACIWSGQRLDFAIGPWLLRPIRRQIGPELRLLISGGARLEADLSWKLETLGWQALAGYGLAETASVFTGNLPGRKRLGSAGTPLADGQLRIANADETGVGEIELRGSSVTSGYRNNPEATRAAFTRDGWFRTGDLGYLDADGFLFVTGRAKEVIVLGGGKKVNPEDLEKTYATNPVIGEIAVLERSGQLVGLVRPNPERLREIGTLNVDHAVRVALAEVGQGLPPYQRLAGFAIAGLPLPRTRLGKYRRFLLPEIYDVAQKGVREAPRAVLSAEDRRFLANPIAAGAWDLVSARYADKGPTLDAHLALDLGVDSLEWMGLSLELEARLGVALFEEDIARIETVRDLLTALIRASARPGAERRMREQRILADRERWLRPLGPVLTVLGLSLFALNKLAMRVLFRLRTEGLEHLPPTGPFLLVPNHVSDLDPLAVAAALPFGRLRRVYWAGDVVRLFGTALTRVLCRAVHLYPVDERMPSLAIETASLVLSRGNAQVWFPEGWRSPDGRLQRFLPGVGDLVVKTRAPALPVYISGTFQAMPRTRRWPRPHPIRLVIGAALDPETLEARGQGESAEERVANALRAEVRALAATIGEEV
jgi:long-chain acyl-CoA synthetase